MDFGNGTTQSAVPGAHEKISLQTVVDGSTPLLGLGYEYDASGNTEAVQGIYDNWRREFIYDWSDRMLRAGHKVGGNEVDFWSYSYDEIGNITFSSEWTFGGLDGS